MSKRVGLHRQTHCSEPIGNIFKEGELEENSVARNFRTTAADVHKRNLSEFPTSSNKSNSVHNALTGYLL
jgi:hypothetical protein